MDTTLRDGEQTPDISYTPAEKLQLAIMLLKDIGVDRIEIASTRVSEGERRAARLIASWARRTKLLRKIEILGYCDVTTSVDWIGDVGGRVLNLLVKGSEQHCIKQLGLTPDKHRARITETVHYAKKRRIETNLYLEDWSNGVRDSFDYVFALVKLASKIGVKRIYLPDTLGIQTPEDVSQYMNLMTSTWPEMHFEYHGHNDYGLSTANCISAVKSGALGLHTSINGMGERAGNSKLAEVVAALHDHTVFCTGINENRLVAASRLVESFSGKEVSGNSPIIGRDVFTQTAGIHADGDAKGGLYTSRLVPVRFGRKRRYALGKLSGRASLDHNLEQLGIELSEGERELILRRIIELGDKKHKVVPEDLHFLIADVLKRPEDQLFKVSHYGVTVGSDVPPKAEVTIVYRGRISSAAAKGDGGYDAFMNALRRALRPFALKIPRLTDFRVRIPPGGQTGALVETVITWETKGAKEGTFVTQGVDSDQMAAAVTATEKMLNSVASKTRLRTPRKGR